MSKSKSNFVKKSRKQKMYKMVGCSKKTRKNYLGGSTLDYTNNPSFSLQNLSYNTKGGSSFGLKTNTNSADPTIPNTGPIPTGKTTIFSNALGQSGGSCGCGAPLMSGGGRRRKGGMCPACFLGFMAGGAKHRNGCRCSSCKNMKGGSSLVPNGLVGSPWTSNGGWPGVGGVPGDNNYYPLNKYDGGDPQTSMLNVGANQPFLNTKGGKKRKQRGGAMSNFLGQDLINLGRQFQFGVGTAYNALAGYSAPVNPMPWKDQFPSRVPFNPATI